MFNVSVTHGGVVRSLSLSEAVDRVQLVGAVRGMAVCVVVCGCVLLHRVCARNNFIKTLRNGFMA